MNQSTEAVSDGYRAVHALDISWLRQHQLIEAAAKQLWRERAR